MEKHETEISCDRASEIENGMTDKNKKSDQGKTSIQSTGTNENGNRIFMIM